MFGKNPIRPPRAQDDGAALDVQQIFATLQGEGPYAGWPAVFVRVGGCNLACDFCDTEFESYAAMETPSVVQEVVRLAGDVVRLVVITGGEPLRQNIVPLCAALLACGFKVQIETNGTLWRELPLEVEVICSPKHIGGGYVPVRGDVLSRVRAFKFIVSKTHPHYQEVGEVGQGILDTPVYVQPMDEYSPEKNAANLAYAAQLAQSGGYILSVQLHKWLGIP